MRRPRATHSPRDSRACVARGLPVGPARTPPGRGAAGLRCWAALLGGATGLRYWAALLGCATGLASGPPRRRRRSVRRSVPPDKDTRHRSPGCPHGNPPCTSRPCTRGRPGGHAGVRVAAPGEHAVRVAGARDVRGDDTGGHLRGLTGAETAPVSAGGSDGGGASLGRSPAGGRRDSPVGTRASSPTPTGGGGARPRRGPPAAQGARTILVRTAGSCRPSRAG